MIRRRSIHRPSSSQPTHFLMRSQSLELLMQRGKRSILLHILGANLPSTMSVQSVTENVHFGGAVVVSYGRLLRVFFVAVAVAVVVVAVVIVVDMVVDDTALTTCRLKPSSPGEGARAAADSSFGASTL